MFDLEKVKGIIFDYGGTIDSNGKHWAEVLWDAYQYFEVPVTKAIFREAYVHVERFLAVNPIVKPEHNFNDLLKIKAELQIKYLVSNNYLENTPKTEGYVLAISDRCYTFASDIIKSEVSILQALKDKYPMVLVSNFYGNVQSVLKDFDLLRFFDTIIESAVVGIRKPDPEIFGLGVKELALPAENIVVIGDSYTKDIVPAEKNGCQTIWLQGPGWGDEDDNATADIVITDFKELKDIFHLG